MPEIDVRKAVPVRVEGREADRELPALEAGLRDSRERAVAVVAKEEIRLSRVADEEIREAVIVEIRPHRRHAPAAGDDARMLRHVLERTVPSIPVEARALGEGLRAPRLPPFRGTLHLLDEDEVEVAVAVEIGERGPAAHRGDELGVEEVAVKAKPDSGCLCHVREQGARDVLPERALLVQEEAATRGAARRDEDHYEGRKPTHEF